MNTHVFIVNEQTLKVHLEYMFAGTGAKDKLTPFLCDASFNFNSTSERNLVGMIADASRIQIDDNIIFYLQSSKGKQGQFFGVFRAKSKAFFDENDTNNYLKSDLGKGLSYRILIEPSDYGVYPEGVTEHELLDSLDGKTHPYELCWSLIYRKLKGNRGCTMITDFEFNDLLCKLQRKSSRLPESNGYTYNSTLNRIETTDTSKSYDGRQDQISIKDRLLYKANRKNAFETHLQAYILQNIHSLDLLPFPEENPWIGNEVSCGVGMQRIDILTIQERENQVFFKVIELKDESPTENIVDYQLEWYIKWLLDYIVPNYEGKSISITPCVVAAKTDKTELLDYIANKTFACSYPNTNIETTEYYAFDISDRDISLGKIL